MWKQSNRVLTAEKLVFRKDPRLRLLSDYTLEIADLRASDQGSYTCEVDVLGKPISIEHTVRYYLF